MVGIITKLTIKSAEKHRLGVGRLTRLAGLSLSMAVLAVLSLPGMASAAPSVSESDVVTIMNRFMSSGIGNVISELGVLSGMVTILFFGGKSLAAAVKSGAGVMSAMPAVLTAVLVGALLINLKVTLGFVAWVITMIETGLTSLKGLLPGTNQVTGATIP